MSLKNKAVLISIRPEWCNLIVRGKKTIEVRKTRPETGNAVQGVHLLHKSPAAPHHHFQGWRRNDGRRNPPREI